MAYEVGPAEVTVDSRILKGTADAVESLVRALGGDFDQVQSVMERTRSYWTGSAGDQYRAMFAGQRANVREILHTVEGYVGDLLQIAGLYDKAEREAANVIQVLPSNFLT